MAIALNLTVPLKQDPETQQILKQLVDTFADNLQPGIDAALREFQGVHFARFLVIDNKYLLVLTEFDGTPENYTEFFRTKLTPVFKAVFSLAAGAPSWEQLNDPTTFFEFSKSLDLKAIGKSAAGSEDRGYLFSAVGDTTVREIQDALHTQQAAQ